MKTRDLSLCIGLMALASAACASGSVKYSPLHPVPDSSVVTAELNNKFAGMWSNIDPDSRGLAELLISQSGGGWHIQAWGHCEPQDCDWGEVQLHLVGASVEDTSFDHAFATWEPHPAVTHLIMRIDGDQLMVEGFTFFRDSSGRSNLRMVQLLRRVARVRVTPRTTTLVSVGETVQLTARAHDVNWNTVSGRTFTWSSSDPSIATVASGLVTAVANGSATITATTNGVSATAMVVVDQASNLRRPR